MSVKLMEKVFSLDLAPMEKLTMLTLANYANDNGGSCFPSVTTLAKQSGMTRRGAQKILRRLESVGLLTPVGSRPGGARQYQITLTDGANTVHMANPVRSEHGSRGERTGFRGGANQSAKGGEPGSPDPLLTVIEPSVEPSRFGAPKSAGALLPPEGMPQDNHRNPGRKKKDTPPPDPRFTPTQRVLADVYHRICNASEKPPWDGHAAKELKQWLASHDLGMADISQLVHNAACSERGKELLRDPAALIPKLRKYHVPLDRFNNPLEDNGDGRKPTLSQQAADSVAGAARLFAEKAPELERAFGNHVRGHR